MTHREISVLKKRLEEDLYQAYCSDARKTRKLSSAREIMAIIEKEDADDVEEYKALLDSLSLTSMS